MHHVKRTVFFALVLLPISVSAQETLPPRSYDLRSAVLEAMEKNPALQQSRERRNETRAGVAEAWATLGPQVNTSLGYDRTKDSVLLGQARFGGDPYNFYSFDLRITQALLNAQTWGGLATRRTQARLADIDSDIAARNLVGNIAKAFSRILSWQRRSETLRGLNAVMEDSLKAVQNRVRIGRSDRIDALQMRTQLALLEPRIAEAENGVRTSTAYLVELMGSPDIDRLSIRGRLEAPSPEQLIQRLDSETSELLQIHRIEAQKELLNAERSALLGTHWPSLNAHLNWGRHGPTKDDLFNKAATRWTAGVALSVPLFSGLSSVHQRRQLASRHIQVRLEEAALRNNLSLAQIQSVEKLHLSYSQILSNQTAQRLAEESQTEGKRQYRFGTIDLAQLLNIQKDVLEASVALENARINYVESLVEYFTATGLPMSELIDILSEGTPL
jgi:outer membrane protein